MSDLILKLPKKLRKNVERNAALSRVSNEGYITKLLENEVIPAEYIKPEIVIKGLPELKAFLDKIPGLKVMSFNKTLDYKWWVKFDIDISHKLAWHIIQELGFVFNYISLTEKLPTVFMPVSPPPYLNGGPEECLSWVIESRISYLDPKYIVDVLEERLPNPVEEEDQWMEIINEEE